MAREWHDVPRVSDLAGTSNRLRVLLQCRCVHRVMPLLHAANRRWLEYVDHVLTTVDDYIARPRGGVAKVLLLKAAQSFDKVGAEQHDDLVACALSNALSYMLAQAAADPDLPENLDIDVIVDDNDVYPAHDAVIFATVSAAHEAGFEICDEVWRDLSSLMAVVKYEELQLRR